MQWILQKDQRDFVALGEVLARLNIAHSFHAIIPFIGHPIPEPRIANNADVIIFGLYSVRLYAKKMRLTPGIFELRPFVHEVAWQPFLLNAQGRAIFTSTKEILDFVKSDPRELFFVRPVEDTKTLSGKVMSVRQIEDTVSKVLKLDPNDIIEGSLAHDTKLMVFDPVAIQKEWRVWIVDDEIVTYSLYKMGDQVVYRNEIDDDAKAFAKKMIATNPQYSPAYVMDICRTSTGLKLLETNCLNSAGFYAADLFKLVEAFEVPKA